MQPLDPINISLVGTKLIEASAGTGKTYAITSLYVRLVVERQLEVEKILLVTFTEAATRELRERVRQRLLDALLAYEFGGGDDFLEGLVEKHRRVGLDLEKCRQRLRLALQSIDVAAIYTIHGFCARILRDCAFESGSLFDLEVTEDDSDLLGQIIDDYWRIHSGSWHTVLIGYLFSRHSNADTLLHELKLPVRVSRAMGISAVDLPPTSDPASFSPPLDRMAALWQQEKETVIELLNSPALSAAKKAFSDENKTKWLGEIDAYFSSSQVGLIPLSALSALSQENLVCLTKKSKKGETPEHDFFQMTGQFVDSLKEAYYGVIREAISYCLAELPLRKNSLGVLAFDDLLFGVREAVAKPETGEIFAAKVRKRYPAVLIDEFQDTDRVQYDIFQNIYGGRDNFLFLLGDPKQAIYRFRGADVYAYLQAVKAAGQEVYNLDTNWRSEAGLIDGVNLLFGKEFGENAFLIPEIGYSPIKVPTRKAPELFVKGDDLAGLSFLTFPEQGKREDAKKNIAEDLAGRIRQLIVLGQEGEAGYGLIPEKIDSPLNAGDIAVLVRNHMDAEIVRSALARVGVRAVVHSRRNVFQSIEARELQILLYGVLQPAQGRKLKGALATTFLGWTAEEILALDEDETSGEEMLGRFLGYQKIWLEKGIAVMLHGLFRQEDVFPRLAAAEQGERRLTNLRHLMEILQDKEHEAHLGMTELLAWFLQQRHDSSDTQNVELRLESDESLVKIVTIHKSKGLEYPIVCCPFLWDSSFLRLKKEGGVPWHDALGNERLDLGTPEIEERRLFHEKETMAEELRLLYVALTRARSRCLVYWGRVRSKSRLVTASSALYYLLHRPEVTLESIVRTLDQNGKSLDEIEFFAPLHHLAEVLPEAVTVETMGNVPPVVVRPDREIPLVPVTPFSGSLTPSWRIRSFSGLQFQSKKNIEEPDHDGFVWEHATQSEAELLGQGQIVQAPQQTLFDFPRGAQAGSCLHQILERLDFSCPASDESLALVRSSLVNFGIAEEWETVVAQALGRILDTPLDTQQPGLSLSQLSSEKRLTEMEFYYSLPSLSNQDLLAIFRGDGSVGEEAKREQRDGVEEVPGFMKGFIDLIFEWGGRYYVLDYKSNYLGESFEDYRQVRLAEDMVLAGYDLQYHIYLVALHRYLQSRLSSYDYDTHIGGAYYLFLRGMSPEIGPESGVFYERPSRDVIEAMEGQLIMDNG